MVARTVVKKQRGAPNFRGWWLTPLGRCSGGIGPVLPVSEGGECVSSGRPSELVATVRCLTFKIVSLWVVGLGAGGQNDQVSRSFTTTVGGFCGAKLPASPILIQSEYLEIQGTY